MNTELKEKQQDLKAWLKKLGLTQPIFAERVFYYINDSDNKEEMKQFIGRFKKAINRDSTDIKLIESYLDILFEQNEFLKIGLVKPQFHYENDFDDIFNQKMKEISQTISERLEEETN
jgi:hypothetical protein